jgi:DNA repair protein RadC
VEAHRPISRGDDRLRERAAAFGVDQLETAELVHLLLGAKPRASEADLLLLPPLAELSRLSAREIERELGLDRRGAARLAAAFALGRRVTQTARVPRESLRSAARVFHLLEADLRGLERETFQLLVLDGKHCLRRREIVSVGTLTASLVHPREVFRAAVREGGAAIVAVHNHPSGDPEPSLEDLEVTRRLLRAGELLGIPLLDHVVIGDGRYVSLRERMAF